MKSGRRRQSAPTRSSSLPTTPSAPADRYRWLWRIANRSESLQVRYLGFSGISLLRRTPVLVLETVGRRTGRRRRAVLAYWEGNGVYLIGGGAAGMSRVDWVANVRTTSDAFVWVRRRHRRARIRELHGAEYERARTEAFRRWPDAPKYERASGRRIPYFEIAAIDEQLDG